jgi:hypothetical protein
MSGSTPTPPPAFEFTLAGQRFTWTNRKLPGRVETGPVTDGDTWGRVFGPDRTSSTWLIRVSIGKGVWLLISDAIDNAFDLNQDVHQISDREAADWLQRHGFAAPAADDPPGGWSDERSPAQWRRVFGVSWRTITRRHKAGKIRLDKITSKNYRVAFADLPKAEQAKRGTPAK